MLKKQPINFVVIALWLGTSIAIEAYASETKIKKTEEKTEALSEEKTSTKTHPFRKSKIYRLESVELKGSQRLTIEQLATNLSLQAGQPLNDKFVMTTRAKLLSLGLFKTAILIMRRGSRKGLAHLIFQVEDDDGVVGKWALGGSLAVTQSESQIKSASETAAPIGYRMELIGRNIFSAQHRASLLADIDSQGILRDGKIAYGLPRFAAEQAQFDAKITLTDTHQRYLSTLGFGGKGEGMWSSNLADLANFQYGAAMYTNTGERYKLPGFPRLVAGPKVAVSNETRLKTFIPSAGYAFATSLLLSPLQLSDSIFEINLAKTFAIATTRFSLSLDTMSVGFDGYGVRGEARYDFPLAIKRFSREQLNLFTKIQGGFDAVGKTSLTGSAAIFGLRYYSSGFIAEFALQITSVPKDLDPKPLIENTVETAKEVTP